VEWGRTGEWSCFIFLPLLCGARVPFIRDRYYHARMAQTKKKTYSTIAADHVKNLLASMQNSIYNAVKLDIRFTMLSASKYVNKHVKKKMSTKYISKKLK
jgi:hypothetical protein